MATRPSSSTDHADDIQAPGTAEAPPRVGEGCLVRYDPEALNAIDGADFSGAAALWQDGIGRTEQD